MPKIEKLTGNTPVQAFLSASRQYLGLLEEKSETERKTILANVISKGQRTPMNSYRNFVQSFLLAASVGALSAGPALADPGCGRGQMGGNPEWHAKMMEQHHTQLHDALKLTAEQEPAWKKLMESEPSRPALNGGQAEDWAKLNAPERAERMLELSKARQAQMAEHVTALKAFYALLTPDQQKIYEDFHSGPGRNGNGGKPPKKSPSNEKTPSKP